MAEKKLSYDDLLVELEELKKQLANKKELEKELAKTRILMQAAFDQSPVPLVIVTYPDFKFKIINKASEDFLLLNASDYLDKGPTEVDWNWQEYFPDGTKVSSVHDLPLPQALHGVITKNKEMYIVRHDGSIVWELASAAPIYDDEGQMIGAIFAANDITERKLTEQIIADNERFLKKQNEEYEALNEELREANDQLHVAKSKAEESDRLKTAFIQNMSHEIRTPMNAIVGFSNLLVDNFDDKEKLRNFSEIISCRCDDLLCIINDILDISKIESGHINVNKEDYDLNSLYSELQTFFTEQKKRIDKQNITITFDLPKDRNNYYFKTDKVKLKQILINLISNSLKFTENGSIRCGCRVDESHLTFHVSDTGIGIPLDKQEFIFERFTQLNQLTHRNISGTGLGLPIVKGLVNLLGGKVWLDSQPGKGTTFYFSIKYEKPESELIITADKKNDLKINSTNKTILIVEDDYFNSEYLKEVFSPYDYKIMHTEKGLEAINIVNTQEIDLILMDIRLPDITGYEASKAILKHKPDSKIIAQTAYAAMDEREKALQNGCIDYISKPTKRLELLSLVNKHLKIDA
jgi:PAS domain S-box-containing protein